MDFQDKLPRLTVAGDFVVKPDWVLGPRTRKYYAIVYFPVGTGTAFYTGGRKYCLNKPCCIITKPYEEHSYHFDKMQPTRHLFFHFKWKHGEAFDTTLENLPTMTLISETSIIPSLLQHILILSNFKAYDYKIRSRHYLYMALKEIEFSLVDNVPGAKEVPHQLIKVQKYIKEHLHRSSLSVAEIAEYVNWSHEHFTRQFVKHMGFSPREAIVRQRVDKACQLLIREPRSIKEIAVSLGFEDEHYFYRIFKRTTGMTALNYRNKYADPINKHLAYFKDGSSTYPVNHYMTFDK